MAKTATALRAANGLRGRPPRPGLRQDILRAAGEIFTQRDYHEVQMDDVARACGVAKGTLYLHFPGKRALFLAVMFAGIDALRAELETEAHASVPPALKIERVVRRTLETFWDRRGFFALIHQNEHKPDRDVKEWFRQRTRLVELVRSVFDQAIAAGHMRAVDSRIATEMLFGMIRGANRYRTTEDTLDGLVAAVVDVLMLGIGTRAGCRALNGGGERKK